MGDTKTWLDLIVKTTAQLDHSSDALTRSVSAMEWARQEIDRQRAENKQLRDDLDHIRSELSLATSTDDVAAKQCQRDQESLINLRASLRDFLENPEFVVSVGGNPITVDRMIARARQALSPPGDANV